MAGWTAVDQQFSHILSSMLESTWCVWLAVAVENIEKNPAYCWGLVFCLWRFSESAWDIQVFGEELCVFPYEEVPTLFQLLCASLPSLSLPHRCRQVCLPYNVLWSWIRYYPQFVCGETEAMRRNFYKDTFVSLRIRKRAEISPECSPEISSLCFWHTWKYLLWF